MPVLYLSPVTHLVYERISLVVRGRRSAVHGGPQIEYTIAVAARTCAGESSKTQQITLKLGEEDVAGGFIAKAVGGLDIDRIFLLEGRRPDASHVLAVVVPGGVGVLVLYVVNDEAEIGAGADKGIHQSGLLGIDHVLGDSFVEDMKVSLDRNDSSLELATILIAAFVDHHVLVLLDEFVGCLELGLRGVGRLAASSGILELLPGRPGSGRRGTVRLELASVGMDAVDMSTMRFPAKFSPTDAAMPANIVMIVVMAMAMAVCRYGSSGQNHHKWNRCNAKAHG